MDTRTGSIITADELKEMKKRLGTAFGKTKDTKYLMEMLLTPTKAQMRRVPPKVGRNEPCPCDSGKKFKKCCLGKPQND